MNGLSQALVKTQHLENSLSPQIAGVPAFFTASRAVQHLFFFKGKEPALRLSYRIGTLAVRTQLSQKPLGDNAPQSRGQQIVCCAHIQQPGNR